MHPQRRRAGYSACAEVGGPPPAASASDAVAMNRFVQIRLKAGVHHIDLGRRVLSHHGLFGNLHVVTAATALRLVESKQAKLRPGQSLSALRHAVESQPESA